MNNSITLKLLPIDKKSIGECARFRIKETGADICLMDPEDAQNDLRMYFNMNDDDIKKYWGL